MVQYSSRIFVCEGEVKRSPTGTSMKFLVPAFDASQGLVLGVKDCGWVVTAYNFNPPSAETHFRAFCFIKAGVRLGIKPALR